mgnify:CR=1 FL=1
MNILKTIPGLLAGLAILGAAVPAHAGEPLIVYTDHSRILTVPRTPGTVIVGNPSIADVTIQGEQVFLHARSYGTTNVIILDDQGNQLGDYDVIVQTNNANDVYVFRAGASSTYICAPDCEATLKVGDTPGFFDGVAKQQQKRTSIALGQKDGESAAPPESQQPQ